MLGAVQILGIRFFDGSAAEAVEEVSRVGGMVVVPAAPALVKLQGDELYRRAMTEADLAIADSGLMVLLWKISRREDLTRISGLAYLNQLVNEPSFRQLGKSFFVLPNELAKVKLLTWARETGLAIGPNDGYVAPTYNVACEDGNLLAAIESRRPVHVVVGIGNGPQEKLGRYLCDNLSYRPAIHCIGAALGFLTGEQVAIPDWADRFYLGWLFRLLAQPRIFIPRLTRALELPWLIFRYGRELPPLVGSRK